MLIVTKLHYIVTKPHYIVLQFINKSEEFLSCINVTVNNLIFFLIWTETLIAFSIVNINVIIS